MPDIFANERSRVHAIRDRNPDVPARTLARMIFTRSFPQMWDRRDASLTCGTFHTEYSRIRRYDAKKKRAARCV